MRVSCITPQRWICSVAGCLLLLAIVVTESEAQRRRGGANRPQIGLQGAVIYTGAFGGTGGGFQFSASMPVPISMLGAQYTTGIQFWYSQPSISGLSITGTQRQLYGYGGYLMATWNIADRAYPYLRLPLQGITSKVPVPTAPIGTSPELPAENTPGTTSSLAIGIGAGLTVPVGGTFSVFGGVTTLASRLYQTNYEPIWSLELGVILSPGARSPR